MRTELTQARLKELLHYDPDTGVFTWRVTRGSRAPAGARAGNFNKVIKYLQIRIDNSLQYGHRLAWLYMTGELPPNHIDHINHDQADNKWSNLRSATHSENMQNKRMQSNNTSGARGVYFDARKSTWNAEIIYRSTKRFLGVFSSFSDAKEFSELARELCFGEFCCHG